MRLKPALFAVAVLAVLALLIRQVTQAVHRTFRPTARVAEVAHSTPWTQNGLTLVEINSVSPDGNYGFTDKGQEKLGGPVPAAPENDTGLWIKLPPNVSLPLDCSGSDDNPCQNLLTLTARGSDGRGMPIHWRASSYRAAHGPTYILASIPAGYPHTVRWADVTLEDHHGDTATWRILRLPPMQHILGSPVTPQTTFHQENIQASADAYRKTKPGDNRTSSSILFDVHGTITNAAHQWEIGHMSQTQEWEPPNTVPPEAGETFGTSKRGSTVSFGISQQSIQPMASDENRPDPYINDNHWVRMGARLQEFETYDETVTFHNVSVVQSLSGGRFVAGRTAQTVTSPSGVIVTLVDVQNRKDTRDLISNDTCIRLAYPQTCTLPSLPSSPLWRKYKRPLTLSADPASPYHFAGGSSDDKDTTYAFRSDKPLPKVIANFPVIIRQRVDLRRVPMTFTLPVGDKAPKG